MLYNRSRPPTIAAVLIVLICGINSEPVGDEELFSVDILVDHLNITQEDEYAYVQYALPDEELFIVGYTPLINSSVAHHMLSCACERPGSSETSWTGRIRCRGKEIVIHGWGRNAPPLKLPEDAGFPVGRNTPYKYIVINIHYSLPTISERVGTRITFTRKPRRYSAGIMTGGAAEIRLPPKTRTIRAPFSCRYGGAPLSIFAVRVHAHRWARTISLYRVRDGQVTRIAKGDPHWPQSFYFLPADISIESNDSFIGECIYDNDDDREVLAGLTHEDEMCRVYAMYRYEPEATLNHMPPIQECWDDVDSQLSSLIPADDSASAVPTAQATPVISSRIQMVLLITGTIFIVVKAFLLVYCLCQHRRTRSTPTLGGLHRRQGDFQKLDESIEEAMRSVQDSH